MCALLSACSDPPPAPTFDFIAYGDCRHDDKVHRNLCAAMVRCKPKYVLVTGDLVDHPERAASWDGFRAITKDLRAASEYLPVAGDHDMAGPKHFEKEFKLDRLYYDRVFGDVHVFFLDSRNAFADREQVEWLEREAGKSTAKHKLAVFHHPPFMIRHAREAEAVPVRENIHAVLVKLRFCAAFCGHQHAFYTTVRDGVRYVVTAGGGAPLSDLDDDMLQPGDLRRKFHHFTGYHIRPDMIEGHVLDKEGEEDADLKFTLCTHPK